jgi:hypothetical protein
MLLKLSANIQSCYRRAADAEEGAARVADPGLKEQYRTLARSWTELGESYQFVQALEQFLFQADRKRRDKGDH